jgi:aminoglycoside phosphotransferase (APT) family kinase protein
LKNLPHRVNHNLPIKPGALVARGFVSEVFAWEEGRVLKLYLAGTPFDTVKRAHDVTRAAWESGLPVPATFDLVEVDGRHGIVFERIDGISMRKHFQLRPWKLFSSARQLAELHSQVHGWKAPKEIPPLRQRLEERIDTTAALSESERSRAQWCLSQLPDGESLCHGDFHPDNILLTAHGPVVIDWGTGSRGDATADVAATSLLFERAPLPPDVPAYLRVVVNISRTLLHRRYLNRYFQLRPRGRDALAQWQLFLRTTLPGNQNAASRGRDLTRLELLLGPKELDRVEIQGSFQNSARAMDRETGF